MNFHRWYRKTGMDRVMPPSSATLIAAKMASVGA